MEKREFTVSEEEAGIRVDKYIAVKLGDEYSRTYVKNLMDQGMVRVSGEDVKPRYITCEGDRVLLEMLPPETSEVEPEDIPLEILYEDDWLIVVNKPAGMVVHPGAGNRKGTLVGALLHHCGKLPGGGDLERPGIVHRLDKGTSGVMVVAKNDRAMRAISRQFQKRTVNKGYVTVVRGAVELDNGVVDAPIGRHTGDRRKMDVDHGIMGKHARTIYHVVKRLGKFTLLDIELDTGRTHQIRVHMKHLGHPVEGDIQYGGGSGMTRPALHAKKLGFTHPHTGDYVEFEAPMPEDMSDFLEKVAGGDNPPEEKDR